MVRLDSFASGIRDGSILADVNFKLLAHDKEGCIKKYNLLVLTLLWITGTWTGHAPCLLLEFLTTLMRSGGQNGSNQCGKMSSARMAF